RERAMEGLGRLRGQGLESWLRRFVHESTNLEMAVGMAASYAVATTARAVLPRLLSGPARHLAAVGLKAHTLANGGAFLLETGTFWGVPKGLHEAFHPGQAWDLGTDLRELAGLGLTLGAMKVSGAMASKFLGAPGAAELSALRRFGQGALHQGAALAG